jgi:hypothetical protein
VQAVSLISAVLQILVYVGAIVVAILLRQRDGKAALLLALGTGCQVLGVLVSVGEALAMSAMIRSSVTSTGGMGTVEALVYGFSLVIALIRLAGFALIFLGLLRLVRRPGAAAAGMGAVR